MGISIRRFQFRVIHLLAAVTVIAIACGWVAHVARQNRAQTEFLGKLASCHPDVSWRRAAWPANHVVYLEFPCNRPDRDRDGVSPTDEDLRGIEALRWLERLNLSHTKITDATLEQVAKLSALTYLNLTGTAVSDAAIADLSALRQLRELDISRTQISREGFEQLAHSMPSTAVIWKASND